MTERTGPDGAYLVVVPGAQPACTFTGYGRRCFGGGGELTTPTLLSGLITAVTYRDGHVCRLSTATSPAAASCPNIGYVDYPPFHPPHVTEAEVRATVTPSFVIGTRFCYRPKEDVFIPIVDPCAHGIPPGYKLGQTGPRTLLIRLSFFARLTADDHHSVYEFSLGRASGPSCSSGPIGGGVAATTMVPIRAGQHVILQDNESPCPATYQGLVTYQPNGGPGNDTLYWQSPIHDHSIVGRFTFVVKYTRISATRTVPARR
ncbi:MAG: hypothetical protein ACLP01_06515 [Solirubrobacteraceae bacterium]